MYCIVLWIYTSSTYLWDCQFDEVPFSFHVKQSGTTYLFVWFVRLSLIWMLCSLQSYQSLFRYSPCKILSSCNDFEKSYRIFDKHRICLMAKISIISLKSLLRLKIRKTNTIKRLYQKKKTRIRQVLISHNFLWFLLFPKTLSACSG